ncbi:hypothetical protein SRB17_25610 [Streptomyces sp. RB17]|uniref:hypothetical protein n=1 Tax=Streptomyces sp. RB17 TaxID=2585197 RepID=UPI00129811D7|nr:hypothetical protein [Streptomyces sp. RB17]MQY34591.1 hypothetical protein [Streptomyces sp. RB17]
MRGEGTQAAAPEESPRIALPERIPHHRLFRTGTLIGAVVLLLVCHAYIAAVMSRLPLYLERGHGYDTTTAGILVALPFLGSVLALVLIDFASQAMTRRGVSNRISRGLIPGAVVLVGGIASLVFPSWAAIRC